MKKVLFAVIALLIVTTISCKQKSGDEKYKLINPALVEVELMEFEQTSAYTYVFLKQGKDEYWAAITRNDELKPGSFYYFDDHMEMKDFHSKELDKTFERIVFINKFSNIPFSNEEEHDHQHAEVEGQPQGSPKSPDMAVGTVQKAEGGYSIAEIIEQKSDLKGKSVKVSGQVVKFTPGVMGKNWIHIQDGSGKDQVADLTVTTDAEVAIGDVVTIEGVLTLDKDFGHGYQYDILVEDAEIVVKKVI